MSYGPAGRPGARPAPLLWSRTDPDRCACDDTYEPVLNGKGVLVKSRDRAWSMMEQTRDPGCLQEHCRFLGKAYRLGYQHHKHSRWSGAGYPDVHLWTPLRPGGGGSAYVELKRMGEDPGVDQVRVMAELQDAGHLMYLARPCCLLTGVVDELMAAFAGRPCLYIKDSLRAFTPVQVPAGAPVPARGPRPAPATAGARRLPVRPAPLPGSDPEPFAPAVGVVVPQPDSAAARTAMHALHAWLRAAGFSPNDVPYPMRLIVMLERLHAHCRVGLAREGRDVRVWRAGTPATEFPEDLVYALGARLVAGPSSAKVAELIAVAADHP
jgi:hypothetical protein